MLLKLLRISLNFSYSLSSCVTVLFTKYCLQLCSIIIIIYLMAQNLINLAMRIASIMVEEKQPLSSNGRGQNMNSREVQMCVNKALIVITHPLLLFYTRRHPFPSLSLTLSVLSFSLFLSLSLSFSISLSPFPLHSLSLVLALGYFRSRYIIIGLLLFTPEIIHSADCVSLFVCVLSISLKSKHATYYDHTRKWRPTTSSQHRTKCTFSYPYPLSTL